VPLGVGHEGQERRHESVVDQGTFRRGVERDETPIVDIKRREFHEERHLVDLGPDPRHEETVGDMRVLEDPLYVVLPGDADLEVDAVLADDPHARVGGHPAGRHPVMLAGRELTRGDAGYCQRIVPQPPQDRGDLIDAVIHP
jgi:hypothetical protein